MWIAGLIISIVLYIWIVKMANYEWEMSTKDKFIMSIFIFIVFIALLYIAYVSYFSDYITGNMFLLSIITFLVLQLMLMIYFRTKYKNHYTYLFITVSLLLLIILYLELPLVRYDNTDVYVEVYAEPLELENTKVYRLTTKSGIASKSILNNNESIYNYKNLTNNDRYEWNKRGLFNLILQKQDKESYHNSIDLAEFLIQEKTNVLARVREESNVQGPSSGLAFYIAALVELKRLDNAVPIAITGQINEDGDVLGVGGVDQKIQNALKIGISHIIVPEYNRQIANDTISKLNADAKIYTVETVEEAENVIRQINRQ